MSISLPKDFIERTLQDKLLGQSLLDALEDQPPVSIRLNPLKSNAQFPVDQLQQVSWCEDAYYLSERPQFTLDPHFHAGAYYSQEAGSMLLDRILRQLELPEHPRVLDLCAAPGGKSTLIASWLNGKGLLVSNEVIQSRSHILSENLSKWGYHNVIVTQNDPTHFEAVGAFFDLLVVDAPCSGEGMFRKDMNARNEWSAEHVQLCSSRQKRILADTWSCLKEGGYLIYSTCTFNEHENESNIQWLLDQQDAELIQLPVPETIQPGRQQVGWYGIPGKSATEGFFVAVVRKTSKSSGPKIHVKKSPVTIYKSNNTLNEFISNEQDLVVQWRDYLMMIPPSLLSEFQFIQQHLRIVKFGTRLGQLAAKGLIPSEELALNPTVLNQSKLVELSREEALRFLRGDTFAIDAPKGFIALCYEGNALGWCKNLGNRMNNLFPKPWRIRMNF